MFFLQKWQNSPTEMEKTRQAQESSSGQMYLTPQLSLVAVQAQELKSSAYLQPTPAKSPLCRYSHQELMGLTSHKCWEDYKGRALQVLLYYMTKK